MANVTLEETVFNPLRESVVSAETIRLTPGRVWAKLLSSPHPTPSRGGRWGQVPSMSLWRSHAVATHSDPWLCRGTFRSHPAWASQSVQTTVLSRGGPGGTNALGSFGAAEFQPDAGP